MNNKEPITRSRDTAQASASGVGSEYAGHSPSKVTLLRKYLTMDEDEPSLFRPVLILFILLISTFFVELGVMFLPLFFPLSQFWVSVISALLLVVIVYPLLINFVFRVLVRERTDAQKMKCVAEGAFEDLVREELRYEMMAKDLEKFKLAMDNVSDQIIITDAEGMLSYINRSTEMITGKQLEDVIGKKAGVLWGAPMTPAFYANMWDTIKKEKKVFSGEIQNKNKEGKLYTAMINIFPVLDKKGEILFFVGVERDITREKALDRAQIEFLSLAAHQLRTPLTGIEWTADLFMRKEQLTEGGKKYLADIRFSVQRLNALVRLFLNSSRLQGGKLRVEPRPLEVVGFVSAFLSRYAVVYEKKQLHVSFTEHPEKLVVITDLNMFEQVVQNLIGNAIDYTPAGGHVTIAIKEEKDDFLFEVRDTGIGIPAIEQALIFERFKRASNAIRSKPDGNGMGLYIVAETIKLLGGRVWFDSTEGVGSTFYAKIPLRVAEIYTGKS